MGIAANQTRILSLTARQSDLELKAQQISAIKMRISQSSSTSAQVYSRALSIYSAVRSLDDAKLYSIDEATGQIKESPTGQLGSVLKEQYGTNALNIAQAEYDTVTTQVSAQEKIYDMELTKVNTEHTAIKTEYDAIKSLIGDNVEKSFNVFG